MYVTNFENCLNHKHWVVITPSPIKSLKIFSIDVGCAIVFWPYVCQIKTKAQKFKIYESIDVRFHQKLWDCIILYIINVKQRLCGS